jgi:TRAP-type C4-dicarboxylate transport system permease small subunit
MKEEKIESLKQELKRHSFLLILNSIMVTFQLLLLIGFGNNWEPLMNVFHSPLDIHIMICSSSLIVFGFGLTAIVHALEISDIKQSLKSYTDGE